MTLPTIVKKAQDRFEKSLLSEEIGGVSAYAQFHGWEAYHGQTVQDFLAQEITNAVREVLTDWEINHCEKYDCAAAGEGQECCVSRILNEKESI